MISPEAITSEDLDQISFDDLIFPPPFSVRNESIRETDTNIPGEIKIDQQGEVYKSYLEVEGFAAPLIQTFDNWIQNILPEQVSIYDIEVPGGVVKIEYLNTYRPENTPMNCRRDNLTYNSSMAVSVFFKDNKTKKIELLGEVHVAKIPIMLGSSLSHTYNRSSYSLRAIKECDNDPGGYFIIKGTERFFLNQEKLRMNRIFVQYGANGTLSAAMTCPTIRGTNVVYLYQGKEREVKFYMHFMGKDEKDKPNLINVFNVYMMIGEKIDQMRKIVDPSKKYSNPSNILDMILIFSKDEWRCKISSSLKLTMVKSIEYGDPFEYLAKKKKMEKEPANVYRENLSNQLIHDLFPQLNQDNVDEDITLQIYLQKLNMLSIMVIRLIETMVGFRLPDNRDGWGIKRLESAGRLNEKLFGGLWKKFIGTVQNKPNLTKQNVMEIMKQNRKLLQEDYESNFTGNWGLKGVKGASIKEGGSVTDVMKGANILDLHSSLRRINTPTSRKTKTTGPRMVDLTQWGYVDPTDTPEGANCGIVKNLSVTTSISIERSEDPILDDIENEKFLFPKRTGNATSKLMLNGKFLGWCPGETVKNYCIKKRRTGEYYQDLCVVLDKDDYLYIYVDGARLIRPLLIVDEDEELVINKTPMIGQDAEGNLVEIKKNLWGADWETLRTHGCVEYIDPFEQEYLKIAIYVTDLENKKNEIKVLNDQIDSGKIKLSSMMEEKDKIEEGTELMKQWEETYELYKAQIENATETLGAIQKKGRYTHCELDPSAILGIAASIIPYPEHDQGPRTLFQCNMGKQALGITRSNYMYRYDTTMKQLAYPARPLVETQINRLIGLNNLPTGENVIVAVMTWKGQGIEDAFIFNKSSIEAGRFKMTKDRTIVITAKSDRNAQFHELFRRPEITNDESRERFRFLDENGIARVGSIVDEGDIIAYKIRQNTSTGATVPAVTRVGVGEGGRVDRVSKSPNLENITTVKIGILTVRDPIVGDKYAPRHAQKGTIGTIMAREDMPVIMTGPDAGVVPDIIINPHSLPSRMTMGMMIEILASKIASIKGERVNASAFRPVDVDEMLRMLKEYGYDPSGNQTMMNPRNGKLMPGKIFIGPCYYQALKHHVSDKIQFRGEGARDRTSRQPIRGRSRKGGLRSGEMERDAFISHGASAIIEDRFCLQSDAYKTAFCNTCGQIAIRNIASGKYLCPKCKEGAEIGKIIIPYAYKYMVQVLGGMGFEMKHSFGKLPS